MGRVKSTPQWIRRWNERRQNSAKERDRLIEQIYKYDSSLDYTFLMNQDNGELNNILYRVMHKEE